MKPLNLTNFLTGGMLLAAAGLLPLPAQAAISIFSGLDQGAPVSGPFPNSNAARSSFLGAASAFGSVRTETFQELAVGTASLGGNFAITGGNVTLVTPYSPPFGGVSSGTFGGSSLYGFPVNGETNWLAFAKGTATFDFNKATNSFGFYATGIQDNLTPTFFVTFNDGASQLVNIPILSSGGASYFGFTDTQGFKSITVNDFGDDAWGLSDVSFNFASGVPEPATWALFMLGFGAVGTMLRKRRTLIA